MKAKELGIEVSLVSAERFFSILDKINIDSQGKKQKKHNLKNSMIQTLKKLGVHENFFSQITGT